MTETTIGTSKQATTADSAEQKLKSIICECSEQDPEQYLTASTELIDYYLSNENYEDAERVLTDNIGYCVNLGIEDKSIGLIYAQRAFVRANLGKNQLVADDICTSFNMNGGLYSDEIINYVAKKCPHEIILRLKTMESREPQNIAWHLGLAKLYMATGRDNLAIEQKKIISRLLN